MLVYICANRLFGGLFSFQLSIELFQGLIPDFMTRACLIVAFELLKALRHLLFMLLHAGELISYVCSVVPP